MNHFDWLTRFWDFVEERDIDEKLVCIAIFYGSFDVIRWAFRFAEKVDNQPGLEVAAIIGAITLPLTYILPKTLEFFFRNKSQ